MSWFKNENNAADKSTDDLQAELTGLCHKMVAQGFGWTADMDRYEKIITELTRRGVTPVLTIKSKEQL